MTKDRDKVSPTKERPRWLGVQLGALAMCLSPLMFVFYNAATNEAPEVASPLDTTRGLANGAPALLELRDVTADMERICLNGYVYMTPLKGALDVTPLLINGHDQSTGVRLVACEAYEKVYNGVGQ